MRLIGPHTENEMSEAQKHLDRASAELRHAKPHIHGTENTKVVDYILNLIGVLCRNPSRASRRQTDLDLIPASLASKVRILLPWIYTA